MWLRKRRPTVADRYQAEAQQQRVVIAHERVEAAQARIVTSSVVDHAALRVEIDEERVRARVEALRQQRVENHFTDRIRAIMEGAHA